MKIGDGSLGDKLRAKISLSSDIVEDQFLCIFVKDNWVSTSFSWTYEFEDKIKIDRSPKKKHDPQNCPTRRTKFKILECLTAFLRFNVKLRMRFIGSRQ